MASIFGWIYAGYRLFGFPQIDWGLTLLLSIFICTTLLFPVFIYGKEIVLAYAPVLGAALAYGHETSIVAVLMGTLIGTAVYQSLPITHQVRKTELDLVKGIFEGGHVIFPLAVCRLLEYFVGPTIIWCAVVYAVIHGVILMIEFNAASLLNRPSLRRYSGSVALLESIPLPFILFGLSILPAGISGLILYAAVPTLVAILMNQNLSMQSNLNRRVQDLSTLSEISNIIRYSTDLDSLLVAVHQQLRSLMGIKNFYVALYNADEDRLSYPISVKRDTFQNWPSRPLTDRLTDKVIRERRPILLGKKAHIEMEKIGIPSGNEQIEAWLGVPLITPDTVLGCLCVLSFNPETEFTKDDLDLLTTLSGQISVALENALLYTKMQQRSFQLEMLNKSGTAISATLYPQEVYAQICKAAMQISGGQQTALYVAKAPIKDAQLVHSVGLSAEYVEKNSLFKIFVEEEGQEPSLSQQDIIPNIQEADLSPEEVQSLKDENVGAYINLPFHTPDGNQACLSIFYNKPQAFPHEEIEFLQTFATQASMALANANLHAQTDQALRKSVVELRILEEIGRKLSEALRSDDLFDLILEYALDYTESPWGSIVIYNAKTNYFEFKAHRGYNIEVNEIWDTKGISGLAVDKKKTINVGDVTKDLNFLDVTDGKTRSQLSVPLIREDQILGVLALESPEINAYSKEDEIFIGQLADQAALAVLNAQLYDETQRWLSEQATLYLVSTRLGGNQSLESTLNTVSQAFSAAMDSHLVGIYIRDISSRTFQLQATMQRDKNNKHNLPEIISQSQYEFIQRQRTKTGPLVLSHKIELPEEITICKDCQALLFPLQYRGQTIGLSFVHVPHDRKFSDKELQLPQSIALQSSISIQNSLLFSDVAQGRDRLMTVLDAVGEGILMIDANGIVTLGNTPIEQITNTPIEEIQNKNLTVLPDAVLKALGYTYDQAYELVVQTLKPHRAKEQDKHNYKYGEHYLERSTAPVWDLNENVLGWVIVIRDVTEEHQISQTRELLTETLVHDLRSPVGAVKTTLDLIEEVITEDEQDGIISQSIQIAQRSTDRVLGLIESLLDISQLEAGSMTLDKEDVDLLQILKETINEMVPVANEHNIILTHTLPDQLPKIHIDANLIKRVVINLLDNAFKFSPDGGKVKLSTSLDADDQVLIQVIDNGPGVPIEYREKIFERFSQIPNLPGKRRGSGLGLTLCRLAVHAHGGEIWVEPNMDEPSGSVFTFTLPSKSKIRQTA